MSKESSSSGGGVGFCGMLAILFIGLKLAGVIQWSWLWVLSPIWISILVAMVFLAIVVLIAIVQSK